MDNIMGLAKKGYEAYSDSQSNVSRTGGEEYNAPHSQNSPQNGPSFNDDEVVQKAAQHGSGDSSLFSSAMGFLNNNKGEHQQPIDEEHVVNAHKEAYEKGNAGGLGASSIGSAAAMQVLKQFTSGTGSGKSSSSQTDLISMAMAEATKLFDQSGGASSGTKQDAVNSAGMTVMKLLVQSKFSGATGGSNSGGLGSLMGLASKFM